MSLSLFRHNEEAYHAALAMLQDTGRAAIIHPTGTGKSFIAFKLCESHPCQKICWLAPSEFIFQTQLENLKAASGGWVPENVSFFTYAKLMGLDREEMTEIAPDYIILDEFHRCGAQMWGQGVRELLGLFPGIPVLGLSATAVRYLDNQRDMADELFDGNVASEITLGEAVVRGILTPPKYVLAAYSFQKELEKYRQRVQKAKNKAVRDAAEEYLEALRRALDKADGLDVVFAKHMPEKDGKYIIFCADYEHLCGMQEKAGEWFHKIDPNPHIYSAYSDDPGTDRELAAFKEDASSHLKLLYCIDMLNEGVHVEDVSGVILLRPTVSPIVYKQQIGRAMAAGKKNHAVIFDIVLNIENLYSIGAVEEEMQSAVLYYRDSGVGAEIVNEHFRIIDEVADCIKLFNSLNDTLSASWELMYAQAESYYRENGNLEAPKRFVTEDGLPLGMWLNTQRLVHAGKARGILTESQVAKLERIGMRWEGLWDHAWEKNLAAARDYYAEYGCLPLNISDKAYHGVKLGRWLARLRECRKSGIQSSYLTPERIDQLDRLQMVWDVPDYLWERNYHAAVAYHQEHGDLDVPSYYVTEDGIRLGAWLDSIRRVRRDTATGKAVFPDAALEKDMLKKMYLPEEQSSEHVDDVNNPAVISDASRESTASKTMVFTAEQIAKLDALDFVWEKRRNNTWEKSYEAARGYQKEHGSLDIPASYVTEDGCPLGRWIRQQRAAARTTLSKERKEKLSAIGMVWKVPDAWERKFALAEQYYKEHGNLKIPADYVADGVWLARWLTEQTARLNGRPTGRNKTVKNLTPEQEQKLASIGIQKNVSRADMAWEEQYAEAKAFYELNRHLRVPKRYVTENGKNLGVWIQRQRSSNKRGLLDKRLGERLAKIGMVWELEDPWDVGYQHAKAYYTRHGDLAVPSAEVCEDGYHLGKWVQNQRSAYSGKGRKGLTGEQVEKLEGIGMVWRVRRVGDAVRGM